MKDRRHIKWQRFRPRLRETLPTFLVDIKVSGKRLGNPTLLM